MILQRITGWFSYRASVRNSRRNGGPWGPILKHVHKQLNPKPRCRSVAQQFMHESPGIVNAAFVSLYGEGKGMDRMDRMNKRNEVAKRLVTGQYKEMVPKLEQRAKETHERELKEWKLELGDVAEADDIHL